jgi:hypothetical protein
MTIKPAGQLGGTITALASRAHLSRYQKALARSRAAAWAA